MRDVMVDLETLGQRPGSVILSIGAVPFNPITGYTEPGFYSVISTVSALTLGATVDADTLDWWRKQSPEAKQVIRDALSAEAPEQRQVLTAFRQALSCIGDPARLRLWGNGASFDNTLLVAAFHQIGEAAPWKFWNDRCFRTLKSTFPGHEPKREGTHHNALDDARHQARWANAIAKARAAL